MKLQEYERTFFRLQLCAIHFVVYSKIKTQSKLLPWLAG
jgi:hypothetical protein